MKSVFLMVLMMVSVTAQASEQSCGVKKKGSDCEVVRVLTRCDVDKQELRRKIARLEKRIKELESQPAKVVYVQVEKKEVFQKTVIKHSILSLYTTRAVKNYDSSNGDLQTAYEPGIKYQYQFNFGLVPEIGINVKGDPILGLGFEF